MNSPITSSNKNLQEDEIDLLAFIKTIWKGRKTIIISTLVFFTFGLFIAIFSPKQYTVTSVMAPQLNSGESKMGGLSSLAAMAGFNMEMSYGTELSPILYPQIVQSVPFKKELMHTMLNFENIDQPISYYKYYNEYAKTGLLEGIKKYTIGLPGIILNSIQTNQDQDHPISFGDEDIIKLTREEYYLIKSLDETVYLNVQEKNGNISLTTIMPEAYAAAQLAQQAQNLLQKYITEFKIEKALAQLNFIEERYIEKKKSFEQAQKNLAQFRDKNKNVSSAIAQTEEEGLQSEYLIAQNVYLELAKQLESSKIQVKENTPVFTIIEPVTVPTEKSKPRRSRIILIWGLSGILAGLGWILGKELLVSFQEKWKEI